MKKMISLLLASAVVAAAGCAHHTAKSEAAPKAVTHAPKTTDVAAPAAVAAPIAGKVVISILFDRGIEAGTNAMETGQRNQVGTWMEKDLLRVLAKAGYEPRLIADRKEYTPGPDAYLLKVKIVRYNPGAKAARLVVGYGAGATSLDIHYDLLGAGDKSLLAKDDGVGSSRDWQFCCRKLNQNMSQAIGGILAPGK